MSGSPAVVRLENVSKRFVLRKDKSLKEQLVNFGRSRRHRDEFWALRDLDLTIDAGSTVGLIGHNGSGKSTLLKVMGGIIEPTTGSVYRRGRIAALLELGAGFHPDLTGRENVFLNAAILGLTRTETAKHFDEIVAFSGVEEFIDTQVKFYSSGMYVRLAFAVAVHVDPDLLLVDEVLAVGDEPFQRKCMDKVAEFQREGRTIILVSHAADQVGRLCDRTLLLDHGDLVHDGDPSEGLRRLRLGFQEARLAEIDRQRAARQLREGSPTQIEAAIIHDVGFRPSQTVADLVTDGSSLAFTLDCEFFDPRHAYDVGIGIETATGSRVYQVAASDFDEQVRITESSRINVSFTIPSHHLGGGHYVVSAAIARDGGEVVAGLNPALWFEVEGSGRGSGVIDMHPDLSIRPRPQTPD
ncbi:ABC transporter ATP-binding protein [Blastococcus sp. Marseille-P5729]|uniref:ABC transporter ATP-binding protein n=1 Tax=Blastococcus sp. Marseille-P5729 TaxID=2086582 RepID=UPI000D0F919B|nr:ABC transporter ATP-binding protein [Blastococcus sp. Marseille-P5729]